MPSTTPDDPAAAKAPFEFEYRWQEGSVPPPHHYRYGILGSTAGRCRIEFVPGYDHPGTPTWVEPFEVDAPARASLRELLHDRQVLARPWRRGLPPSGVGGSQRSLRLRCGEQEVELPAQLVGDDAALADTLAQTIIALVPEAVWSSLRQRHAAYVAARV